jgi:Kef-type K+ transport system membrane component KefB
VVSTEFIFLLDVGVILLASQLSSELFRRMKLPGLLGAIFAGVLIGPNVFGVVSSTQTVNTIALLGALLVLFVIGLEFPAESFFRIGKIAFLLTTFGTILSFIVGYSIGQYLGWTQVASVLLGAVLAPSGTSVIAASLQEAGKSASDLGRKLLAASIIDDVEGIILLSIALSITANSGQVNLNELIRNAVVAVSFVFVSIFLGAKIFPEILKRVIKVISEPTLFALFLGGGLVLAYTASLLGLSPITGAFLVGAIIPVKKIGEKMFDRILLMETVFAAVFFTTIGMSIQPHSLLVLLPVLVLAILGGVGARLLGGLSGAFAGGLRGKVALLAAIALIARAEMSLIIAKGAVDQGLANPDLITVAAIVVVVSIGVAAPALKWALHGIETSQEVGWNVARK